MTKSITENELKTLLLNLTPWVEAEKNSKALRLKIRALIAGSMRELFSKGSFHTNKLSEITITIVDPEPDQILIEVIAPIEKRGHFTNVSVTRSVIPE